MKRLTKTEEQRIIYDIMDKDDFIGNGSSRAVFGYTKDLVVKVALDRQGQRQNANEIQVYRDHGHYAPVAKITSYGKNIVVMERVNPIDYDEIESVIDGESGGYEDEDGEWIENDIDEYFASEVRDAYDSLTDINGETSDNFQIGYNLNGKIVAYDYGYYSGGHGELVSRKLERFLCRENGTNDLLDLLAKRMVGSHRKTKRIVKVQQKFIEEAVSKW